MFEITKILAFREIATLLIVKEESQTVAQKLAIDVRLLQYFSPPSGEFVRIYFMVQNVQEKLK